MIDLKALRENPERFKAGAAEKQMTVDIDRVLALDARKRELLTKQETLRAEQKKLAKASGPMIGQLMGCLKNASDAEKPAIEAELAELKAKPATLKSEIQTLDEELARIQPELDAILLDIPQPADPDVPRGESADDNIEIRQWAPDWWDPTKSFRDNKGFDPKTHLELVRDLDLVDFERGVKVAGTRNYVLKGDGFRLHQAVLRFAFDTMIFDNGFAPRSVPVLVREEAMVGTGFFPHGKDQSYHIEETKRGGGHDIYLTGTGEVGLMSLHQGEILDEADLPLKYITVSPCFRREAGAAGKDTAGLYRIHQFEKVEQVVICRADEAESRQWHQRMISYVENILQKLELPYRLLQCCTGDLGPKNADMIDIECWMPGRGDADADGLPTGDWGETHSASRLYDFQCRRLNLRYRPGGETGKGPTTFCHSLNNTVLASPRFLIPMLEMHQQPDGSIAIPKALQPYMNGQERIGVS
ncbi:MAG TPA: serine--tRNA ligase [Phycisphaerales bacterium]|nr:serine--tRNA ligase [Phycisphaerales bacterium]